MELEHLHILRILVADPNLTRGAERLHLTQSGLSKRVQAMEAELGFTLFERRGPLGLRPLPQAYEMMHLAERLLGTWESGVKKIQSAADSPQHFVLVGPQLFLREVILPRWNRVRSDFPGLQFEVQVSTLSQVSLETIQTGADAAILEHREELADFTCRHIFTERWGIVRHPAHHFDELRAYQWASYSSRDNPVDVWLVKRQKLPRPNYQLFWQDLTAIAHWVAATPGGASVLPWHAVSALAQEKRLVFEPLAEATSRLYLAHPKKSAHHRLLKALAAVGHETLEPGS